jgi:hypothetical protein
MGEFPDDICSATPPTITGRYSIPYDVDFLWNEGCGGSDWWDDDAGTSVNLLVSDTGSAYVCPSGSEGFWRIYVDRWGQPWELGRWPRPSSKDYEVSDASDEFADILKCAGESGPVTAEAMQKFKICSLYHQNQAIHAMQLGLEVALPKSFSMLGADDWALTFVEDGIIMDNDTNSKYFFVDNVPIVSNLYEAPEVNDDWADDHNHVDIDIMEATDAETLVQIVSAFLSGAENAAGLERAAMELAAKAFDRACSTRFEIEAFEKACYQ